MKVQCTDGCLKGLRASGILQAVNFEFEPDVLGLNLFQSHLRIYDHMFMVIYYISTGKFHSCFVDTQLKMFLN